MKKLLRAPHGFTFLEIVVVLAVLGALLAFLAPTLLSTVTASRENTTLREMAGLYDAMVGDQRETFGYVGDVGDYPASLVDLVVSPGLAGWNGPYLTNVSFENNQLVDPYGQPYEYYLLTGAATSDQLAIISRGADGVSTNTAADPNTAANFLGTAPSAADYTSGANNADNLVYPTPSSTSPNALNVEIFGTLALNIQGFDSNALVNAFVPACPNLYEVTVTSTRGTEDVSGLGYGSGFQVDLVQGTYQVLITAQNLSTAPFNERLQILPGETVTRSLNFTGLDSSGTDPFILTITNLQPSEAVEVFEFSTMLSVQPPNSGTEVPAGGGVRSFFVKACSQVFVKRAGATSIRDQLVMLWGAFARSVGATAATLTATNNTSDRIKLFSNDVFLGEVKKGKTESFKFGLLAGDVIKAYDDTVTTLLKTVTLVTGANTLVVP